MKEIAMEEMEAGAGGVLDEEEKRRLLTFIRIAKNLRMTKEACLDAHRRNGFTEEQLAYIAANW